MCFLVNKFSTSGGLTSLQQDNLEPSIALDLDADIFAPSSNLHDFQDGLSARSASSMSSAGGMAISQAMDSHLVGFARPPTELHKAEIEREQLLAKQLEEERIAKAYEEQEIKMRMHTDYWSNLAETKEKDDKKVEHDVVYVERRTNDGGKTFFTEAVTTEVKKATTRTAIMWERARKASKSNKRVPAVVKEASNASVTGKSERSDEIVDVNGVFIPSTRPNLIECGEDAFRPPFRAKPAGKIKIYIFNIS
jgi:hypothetical protein